MKDLIYGANIWLMSHAIVSPETGRRYTEAMRRVQPILASLNISPTCLNKEEAKLVYAKLLDTYKPGTAITTIRALSSLWESLIAQGIVEHNPWRGLKLRPPKQVVAERILTIDEIRAIINAADEGFDRTLLRFLFYSGARVSEAVNLRWRDVHPIPGGWSVTLYGKGGKTRHVRLRAGLYDELRAISPYGGPDDRIFPVTRTTAWRIVRRAAHRAGIQKPVSPHWFRHSHASLRLDAGANIRQVQADLGHSKLETTQIYLHVHPGQGGGDELPEV